MRGLNTFSAMLIASLPEILITPNAPPCGVAIAQIVSLDSIVLLFMKLFELVHVYKLKQSVVGGRLGQMRSNTVSMSSFIFAL